ncbi:MAG: maleylpyruvate isomerase N-terminal domain-containing protein [Actinomycetota bacterium]|nr:maleylpyruvate isomerase N-terminal domain-containing protein [Actinomycetota bacterium]
MAIDLADARSKVAQWGERSAALVRGVPDANVRMPNSEWTIRECVAHFTTSLRAYAGAISGNRALEELPATGNLAQRVAAINQKRIATVAEADPKALGDLIAEATKAFLQETEGLAAGARAGWYENQQPTVAGMTGIMLGEIVIHTYDIAQTAGKPWPIDGDTAAIIAVGGAQLYAGYVNEQTTKGVHAAYEVNLRNKAKFYVTIDDGKAIVGETPVRPVDCKILADPVSLVLISFGRIGLWGPVFKGKILSYGKKPWLGLKFQSYFINP